MPMTSVVQNKSVSKKHMSFFIDRKQSNLSDSEDEESMFVCGESIAYGDLVCINSSGQLEKANYTNKPCIAVAIEGGDIDESVRIADEVVIAYDNSYSPGTALYLGDEGSCIEYNFDGIDAIIQSVAFVIDNSRIMITIGEALYKS